MLEEDIMLEEGNMLLFEAARTRPGSASETSLTIPGDEKKRFSATALRGGGGRVGVEF